MWNSEKHMNMKNAALADGYMEELQEHQGKQKFSGSVAMVLGFFITVEIIIGGAMLFQYDFHGVDMVALVLLFMVLYSGIVAALTDK